MPRKRPIGILLPLLRRFSARTQMLIAAGATAGGLALALILVLEGHGRENALLIRVGMLTMLAGLGLLISGVRSSHRVRGASAAPTRPMASDSPAR